MCYYCPDRPGFIADNDMLARKLDDGSWKCGECVTTDIRRKMVKVLGPDHGKTREFMQKEQREVNEWNKYVDRWTQLGAIDLKKMKNKYL